MDCSERDDDEDEYYNFDMTSIVTPVNVQVLHRLLKESNYDEDETQFIVNGFTHGFDLGYRGPWARQDTARNIPFQVGVGNKQDMWKKIMKEVKAKRYAGPFSSIPFKNYVQSPIGLVPKAGNQTRLIFHLSYDFGNEANEDGKSINHHTPHELCTVQYNNIDHAIGCSLNLVTKLRLVTKLD